MVNSRPVTSKQRGVTKVTTKPPATVGKPAPNKVYKPGEIDKEVVQRKNDPAYQARQKTEVASREAKKKADKEAAAALKKKGIAVNKQNIAGYQKKKK